MHNGALMCFAVLLRQGPGRGGCLGPRGLEGHLGDGDGNVQRSECNLNNRVTCNKSPGFEAQLTNTSTV